MLTTLNIQNIALIEKLSVEVRQGMTVLTGETGAGKSIVIDAVNLLLGERTNKALVRYGTEKARVQALFDLSENVKKLLVEQGIDIEEEQALISREITSEGKSVCRINGTIVTATALKEIGTSLINIHGQHDNQALLNPVKHIDFLDEYAKTELENYTELYQKRRGILKEIEKLSQNEQERLSRLEFLEYQVDEIEAAQLVIGEKEELTEQKNIIVNAEKIVVAVNEAYNCLYEENSAYDAVSRACGALERISGIDAVLDEVLGKISEVRYIIEDSVHELSGYADGVEYSEADLNEIEERLDLITRLERKYGGSIEAVLKYFEEALSELDSLSNADEKVAELQTELDKVNKQLKKEAEKITEHRRLFAKNLTEEIEQALFELDMPKVRFEVGMAAPSDYDAKGADKVEFLICPNVGEQMKPLVQIASGGELSRVMLAIKSILSDSVDTLIFDEIDTGVSGSAAQKIAKKLSALAKGKQVICVSHQPQLAAIADNHYKLEKHTEGDRTITELKELEIDERVMEIARIIDGDNITETAVKHAKEMLAK